MNSEAKRILDERLAKGEISIEEYKEMANVIDKQHSADIPFRTTSTDGNKIYSTLILLFSIGLTVLFLLLGGDIIDRWRPYSDRPFAFLFLFGLITNVFLGVSCKWKSIGFYGALAMSIISFLYFVGVSMGYLNYASSIITNILLLIHIVFLYIFTKLNKTS